jgi:hypothetical protein
MRRERESGSSSNSRFSASNYDFFDQHQQRHLEWKMEEKGECESDDDDDDDDGGRDEKHEREPPCANLLQLLGEGVGAGFTGLALSSQGLRRSTVGERLRCANPTAWLDPYTGLPFTAKENQKLEERRETPMPPPSSSSPSPSNPPASRFHFARPPEPVDKPKASYPSLGVEAQLPNHQNFGWQSD